MNTRKRNLKKAQAYTRPYSLKFLDALNPLKVKKLPRKIKKKVKRQTEFISKTLNNLTNGCLHTNYSSLPCVGVLGKWVKANKVSTGN